MGTGVAAWAGRVGCERAGSQAAGQPCRKRGWVWGTSNFAGGGSGAAGAGPGAADRLRPSLP